MHSAAIIDVTASLSKALECVEFDINKESRPAARLRESKEHLETALKKMVQGNVMFKKADSLRTQVKRQVTMAAEIRKVVIADKTKTKRINALLRSVQNDISTLVNSLGEMVTNRQIANAEMPIETPVVAAVPKPTKTLKSMQELQDAEDFFREKLEAPKPEPVDDRFNLYLHQLKEMENEYAQIRHTVPTSTPRDLNYTLFVAPIFVVPEHMPPESAWERSNLPYKIIGHGVLITGQHIMGVNLNAVKPHSTKTTTGRGELKVISDPKRRKMKEKIANDDKGSPWQNIIHRAKTVLKVRFNSTYVDASQEYEDGYWRMPGSQLGYVWLAETRHFDRLGGMVIDSINFPFVEVAGARDKKTFTKFINDPEYKLEYKQGYKPGQRKLIQEDDTNLKKLETQRVLREKMENELKEKFAPEFKKLAKYQDEKTEYQQIINHYKITAPVNEDQTEELEVARSAFSRVNKKIKILNEKISNGREKLVEKYRGKK